MRGPGATPATPHVRTPGPAPSSARKRGREGDDHTNPKKSRPGGTTLFKSPSKGALLRSPNKVS